MDSRRGRGWEDWGFGERLTDGDDGGEDRNRAPGAQSDVSTEGDEERERDEEFAGRDEPDCVAHARAVAPERQGEQPGERREERGLPEMVSHGRHLRDLFGEFQKVLFGGADVVEGERAGVHQVRHDGAAVASEEGEQIVHEFALRGFARDASLEDESGGDLLYAAKRLLTSSR